MASVSNSFGISAAVSTSPTATHTHNRRGSFTQKFPKKNKKSLSIVTAALVKQAASAQSGSSGTILHGQNKPVDLTKSSATPKVIITTVPSWSSDGFSFRCDVVPPQLTRCKSA